MLKKYFLILSLLASPLAYAQQQIEVILFKDINADIDSDYTLYPNEERPDYEMHSYYEPKYHNLITRALSSLTLVNFENRIFSSAITESIPKNSSLNIESSKHLEYTLLADDKKKLNDIKHKLELNNEIIMHIAWQQQEIASTKYLIDSSILDTRGDISPTYDLVYGTIIAKNTNNLDMKFDLILAKDDNKYKFTTSKRIRPDQLTYIDQDSYGMLIMLTET